MLIHGKLSLLTDGLIDPKEIVGKPITLNGNQKIGTIVDIDKEKDIFFGELDDSLICSPLLEELKMKVNSFYGGQLLALQHINACDIERTRIEMELAKQSNKIKEEKKKWVWMRRKKQQ